MKKLALLLIITGALIALYPLGEWAYTHYLQQKTMVAWEEEVQAVAEPEKEVIDEPAGVQQPEVPLPIAVLTIKKINLELPVFQGATTTNLRIGAGLVEDGVNTGESGTVIISAHRSHTFGRQFNRLDELEKGDQIEITSRDGVYKYEVYKTDIVKPEEIAVQQGDNAEKTLLLITCHPLYSINPPYRLLVWAKQIEPA